jgi:hypothetical protein
MEAPMHLAFSSSVVCSLFNNTLSETQDYTASGYWKTVNYELDEMWKGAFVSPNMYSELFLEELQKYMKTL